MKNFVDSPIKRNQRLVSNRQLFFSTSIIVFFILLKGVWTQGQGTIAACFLVCVLPLTFCLAIYPIRRIDFNRISSVLDPRVWLPLSYIVYFVALPCISILLDSKYPMYIDEIPQVMLSTLLGIVSLQLGLHILKPPPESVRKVILLYRSSAALLLLFTLLMHLYYWYWRIQNGYFFTHGASYMPIPNVETGIRDLLGASVVYIPLYILAVAYRNKLWKKSVTLSLFIVYVAIVLVLNLLSGQIRPLFFLFLMILASTAYMLQSHQLRWRRAGIVISCLLVSSIIFIYILRYSASQIAKAENPVKYILSSLPDIIEKSGESAETSGGMDALILSRIFMSQEFFFKTVRSLNENSSYGYGSYTMKNLPIIVPRLLWPEKGPIDDTEVLIQQDVHRSIPVDSSLTPLTQFYAEWNIVGIFIGFFMIGLISSYVHKVCLSLKNLIGGLVCWILILGSILQFEANTPIDLLISIRNGLFFVAFASIVSIFSKRKIIMRFF